jgi:asparagine synthase (glutamine-hydrolysing)
MCGLAGFIGFDDNVKLAKHANECQKHRGPDNQSLWHDNYIALAHQRLSIIDLSDAANQPFHKHGFIIIFNGEIYNYKELRKKLQKEKQVIFTTSSDTEVLLELYHHYGKESLNELIGMFVFAIYHTTDHSIFIARDHFGIKPLFYTQIGNSLAFSSELKTLVNVPGFNKAINPKSLVSCLNYLWVSGNESMFLDCYKLPPAHYLTYTQDSGIQISKYWELSDTPQNHLLTEDAVADQVAEVISSSITRHMVADVPVSSFLSGGLDSSLIAVLAKKINTKLSTYTISTFEKDRHVEQMPDDEKYASLVAKEFDINNHVIRISPDILKDLPEIVRTLDEPIGDPAAINTYLICKAARKEGVKVLLSGMGADEIYFGYRRQKATLMAIRYNKLPSAVKNVVAGVVTHLPVKILGKGFKLGRWAKRFISFATLPVDQAYMRSYSYYDSSELKQLFKSEFADAVEKIQDEHKLIFNSKFKNDVANQLCNTDLSMFMLGLNLTYTDRASMAASVEVRVPFIDKDVVTDAMKIAGKFKIKKGVTKYILKKAAEKYLPKQIIYRKKAAFGAPIRSWISNDLRELVDNLLSEKSVVNRGFLNYSFVKNLIENDRKGLDDNAYQIYQLLTLEIWCREYLDKNQSITQKITS